MRREGKALQCEVRVRNKLEEWALDDIPNNLYIQHPCLQLLNFNTEADSLSAPLPLFFHPEPQLLKLPLLGNIGALPR